MQVVRKDPDTVLDPHTEVLHKWSYTILDPGSWYERCKRSWYRDLAQVVLQHTDRSGRKGSWNRDLAQVLLQDDTSDPKGAWYRDLAHSGPTGSLHTWSNYRILIQVVRKGLDTGILKQRSCTSGPTKSWYKWSKSPRGSSYRDPETEILHKCYYRILRQVVQKGSWYWDLAQVVLQDPGTSGKRILIQRSCTSGPTASWYKWSTHGLDTRSWRQRSCTRGLAGTWKVSWFAQVVLQDPETSGPKGSSYRDPETERYKWSKRILIQRSCYKCRANLPSLLVGVHSHTLFGVSCRDTCWV